MSENMSIAQANMLARQAVVASAVKRTQTIHTETIDTSTKNSLSITPRNAGLLLGFIVNVKASFSVGASGTALTATPLSAANLIQQITFYDLNNNMRLNTSGAHLALLASARANRPYLGVDNYSNYPIDFGEYYTDIEKIDASVAQSGSGEANFSFYVPISYSDVDLRGSTYLSVVNSNTKLDIQLNPNMVQARTVQGWEEAVYATADSSTQPADVTEGNVDIQVQQVYYDQLPQGQNGVILPVQDMATVYELKNSAVSGMTPNQDFPIAYSNFRDFLSTIVFFRNSVEANGFAAVGDIVDWKLETANFTNIFDVPERTAASWNRMIFGQDLPTGCFMFDTRNKPIATNQYGNMNLILNPAQVDSGAMAKIFWESFALQNVLGKAGSLAPGA